MGVRNDFILFSCHENVILLSEGGPLQYLPLLYLIVCPLGFQRMCLNRIFEKKTVLRGH